jgi:hypothetical protein
MNSLPRELVDHISSFLTRDDLKNTLMLSRKFQYAAEQHSGAFSMYALTEDNAERFLAIYSGRHFRHLRSLEFRTSVSPLELDNEAHASGEYFSCRDTKEELQQMDEDFSRQIHFLSATLEAVESAASKVHGTGKINLTLFTLTRLLQVTEDDSICLHRMFTSWRVHLLSSETLPSLTSVRTFLVKNAVELDFEYEHNPSLRKLDHRVLVDIASKLSNLDNMRCEIGGNEWPRGCRDDAVMYLTHDWEGPRRDSRHDFAEALKTTVLPYLRHVRLDFIYPLSVVDWIDHRLAMPNLVKPELRDPFSSSLRLLSYQLRTLNIRLVADETLFWPADGSTPAWPNLESVNIVFYLASPSGTWYLNGPLSHGAIDATKITNLSYPLFETSDKDNDTEISLSVLDWNYEGQFCAQDRVIPNDKTLVPFLTAFAKAAALMPSLKEIALWAPLHFIVEDLDIYDDFDTASLRNDLEWDLAWGLAYTKPGVEAFSWKEGHDYAKMRQIWWRVADWRPDPVLYALIQQIGSKEHREELKEHWEGPQYGNGLVGRECFLDWEKYRWNY